MVAGLRGSSSGIPASTLPTMSDPTSAALVNIPPPTLAKSAIDEAPNPKAATVFISWKIIYKIDIPRMPIPTTDTPITAPLENATLRPELRLTLAAAAVRVFALIAILIPKKPVVAEHSAPTT